MWSIKGLAILLTYHTLKTINAPGEFSPEERSQRGVALLNHAYSKLYSHNYPGCLMACMEDPGCMSLNYWWYKSQCDLNNKTKYSAESKFLCRDTSSTYMGLMREPGIVSDSYAIRTPGLHTNCGRLARKLIFPMAVLRPVQSIGPMINKFLHHGEHIGDKLGFHMYCQFVSTLIPLKNDKNTSTRSRRTGVGRIDLRAKRPATLHT